MRSRRRRDGHAPFAAPQAIYVVVMVASVAALAALWSLTHLTVFGQRVDGDPHWPVVRLHWAFEEQAEALRAALPILSGVVALVVAIPVAAARLWLRLICAITVPLVAGLLAGLLKAALVRPDLGVAGYAGNSFPSSNAAVVAGIWVGVWGMAACRLRPWVAVGGVAITSLAMVASVITYAHRLSDVLGSVLVVAAVTALTGLLAGLLERRRVMT